ncbi:MAG TPA: hypothetical protein VLK65_28030 [Vicinamibacteria bacterium]|nr:hypothetical protein [Vicinamibacteria bacterium]
MARLAAKSGDDVPNDLIVSDVIRWNELQVWFGGRMGNALTPSMSSTSPPAARAPLR